MEIFGIVISIISLIVAITSLIIALKSLLNSQKKEQKDNDKEKQSENEKQKNILLETVKSLERLKFSLSKSNLLHRQKNYFFGNIYLEINSEINDINHNLKCLIYSIENSHLKTGLNIILNILNLTINENRNDLKDKWKIENKNDVIIFIDKFINELKNNLEKSYN